MTDDIFAQIGTCYNRFTKTEKRVADFVLEKPEQVLYMSITDLADACGVGDTSVFRFCRDLDKKGYQDFKMALAGALASARDDLEATQMTGAVSQKDSLEDVVKKVLATNVSALHETYRLIRLEDIDTAVEWMIQAKNIYFFGVGGSMVAALEAQSRFMRITSKVHMTIDLHLQAMSAALMNKEDLAIAFSYSGATKDTLDVVSKARAGGARIIGITRFTRSPLAALCDLRLLCGANEGPMQGGSMSVKMSQLLLLDLLYIEYFKRTYDVSARQKAATAEAISNKLY